jgi:hypothetical protein
MVNTRHVHEQVFKSKARIWKDFENQDKVEFSVSEHHFGHGL